MLGVALPGQVDAAADVQRAVVPGIHPAVAAQHHHADHLAVVAQAVRGRDPRRERGALVGKRRGARSAGGTRRQQRQERQAQAAAGAHVLHMRLGQRRVCAARIGPSMLAAGGLSAAPPSGGTGRQPRQCHGPWRTTSPLSPCQEPHQAAGSGCLGRLRSLPARFRCALPCGVGRGCSYTRFRGLGCRKVRKQPWRKHHSGRKGAGWRRHSAACCRRRR